MSEIINKDNFEEKVLKSNDVVLVDFFATWCGPCKMIAPVLDKLSEEYKVYKVDIDNDTDLAISYGVRSVPTLLFFKEGKIVHTEVGALPYDYIKDILEDM